MAWMIPVSGAAAAPLYAEFVPAASSGTTMGASAVGIITAAPTDGNFIGGEATSIGWRADGSIYNNNAVIRTTAGWDTTNVPGIGFARIFGAAHVLFYLDGVWITAVPIADYLTGAYRLAASVVTNSVPDLTITGRFASGGWTDAPAGATPASPAAVFLDEGSGTVTGSGLTINEGAVGNHTPYRTDTNVSL